MMIVGGHPTAIVSAAVQSLGNPDPARYQVAHPFLRSIEGVLWGAVTDGHACLMWRKPEMDLPIEGVPIEKVVPDRDPALEVGRVQLTTLLRWLNGQTLQDEKPCETCRGSGIHNCDCGSGHQCGKCEGSGQIVTPRHVDIGGQVIPLPRLVKFLRAVIVESEVIVQGDGKFVPLAFFDVADRWRMIIVQPRDVKADVVFDAWTVAA